MSAEICRVIFGIFGRNKDPKPLPLSPEASVEPDLTVEPEVDLIAPSTSAENTEEVVADPLVKRDPIEQTYVKTNNKGVDETRYRWYDGWKTPPWVCIVHYSAGYNVVGCKKALVDRGLSVHASIERDGVIFEHVSDKDRGIHAGDGKWCGDGSMNNAALGFEIINLGHFEGLFDSKNPGPHFVFDPARNKTKEIDVDVGGRV